VILARLVNGRHQLRCVLVWLKVAISGLVSTLPKPVVPGSVDQVTPEIQKYFLLFVICFGITSVPVTGVGVLDPCCEM